MGATRARFAMLMLNYFALAADGSFWSKIFDVSDYPPRWLCGNWSSAEGWLHIASDVGTWFAYTCIPILMAVLILRRKKDIPKPGLFGLFAAFILLCGSVHLMEAVIFWWPAYRLAGLLKLATAVVSIVTVIALSRVLPEALELKGPRELEEQVEQRTAELRESERRGVEALARAEAADDSKSRFLASMSHELRTPVAAILGTLELLALDEDLPEATRAGLETVQRNANHQLGVINDVLELSRIESGAVTFDPRPLDPTALAAEALDLVASPAAKKGLEVELLVGNNLGDEWVCLDPLRVRQVLVNLLSNAIKFSQQGRIEVRVESDVLTNSREHGIRYSVIDEGIGLSESQCQSVFDPYRQADTQTFERFGGTGLGLSISRELARKMGGDLEVTSALGEGSTFTFTCRGAAAPRASQKSETPASTGPHVDLAGVRVLLAEDQADLALIARKHLERADCEVVIARNGQAALDEMATTSFDILLLDIQMPVMDGLTAASALRERGWPGPIVALTANAMIEDRQACFEVGFDGFAVKPLKGEALRKLVLDHARGRQPTAGPAPHIVTTES